MNAPKVDVLAVLDKAIQRAEVHVASVRTLDAIDIAQSAVRDLYAARHAIVKLIERDKVAAQVFDCILRGVNDLTGPMGCRSEQFVAGWLKSWAKSLHAAGFKPSDTTAPDIARAIARIGGTA